MRKIVSLILVLGLCLSLCACGSQKGVTSIVLSDSNVNITIGETYTLSTIILPEDVEASIKWQSANTNVASIDENGMIQAVSIGTTTIVASAENGVSANCSVTVVDQSAYDKLNITEQKFVDVFVENSISYFKAPDSVIIRKIAEYEGNSNTGGDFWMIELSSTNSLGGTDVGVYFLSMNGSKFVDGGDEDMFTVDDYDCELITLAIQERR